MSEENVSPRQPLDMVVPEITQLFEDILKYRVDPQGLYYSVTVESLVEQIKGLNNN